MSTFITLSSWPHTLRVDTQLCVAARSTLAVLRRWWSPLEAKRRMCREGYTRQTAIPRKAKDHRTFAIPAQHHVPRVVIHDSSERERGVRVREIGSENLFAPSHGRPTPRREYGIVRVTTCVEIANREGFSAQLWTFGVRRYIKHPQYFLRTFQEITSPALIALHATLIANMTISVSYF